MALIVVIASLCSSFLVYLAAAQGNHTVASRVNMNCRCNAVGLKFVNIFWQPLPQDPDSFFEPSYYRVFFCTSSSCNDSLDQTGQYQLGCTHNTTQKSLKQKELQCKIGGYTLFPLQFNFILEMRNSTGIFVSKKESCRLVMNIQCTKPRNFRVTASGKRNLSVSWEPPPYMGSQTPILCYRIWYASTQGKNNETLTIRSDGELSLLHTIFDLNPYTKYTFFIQCSFAECLNGWGALSGPVTGMTKEEVPAKAPEFENLSISNIEKDKRDVIVVWKLPPWNTWNGVLKKFVINYWEVLTSENDSFIRVPNSSRNLQINSGSAKEATLLGLKRFADYQTQIRMCTSEGCGPKSHPWGFRGEAREMKINKAPTANSSPWLIIGIMSGAAVILVILVFVIYKCVKTRRRRRNLPPLNDILPLEEPPLYANQDDSGPSTQNSYDEIRHVDNPNVSLHASFQREQSNSDLDT